MHTPKVRVCTTKITLYLTEHVTVIDCIKSGRSDSSNNQVVRLLLYTTQRAAIEISFGCSGVGDNDLWRSVDAEFCTVGNKRDRELMMRPSYSVRGSSLALLENNILSVPMRKINAMLHMMTRVAFSLH